MNTVINKKEKKYVRHKTGDVNSFWRKFMKTGDVQLFQTSDSMYDTSFPLYLPKALTELNSFKKRERLG